MIPAANLRALRLTTMGDEICLPNAEVFETFDDMNLKENLVKGINAYGFENPSEIQQRGIVPFCRGSDVIEHAESEPGRAITLCSGILQQIDCTLPECQALVLVPKDFLVVDIKKVMKALGTPLGVVVDLHVKVGLPGNVLNLLELGLLCPNHIKMFVLDEADVMASLHYQDKISKVFKRLPSEIQVGIFSETMPQEVAEIVHLVMNEPVRIVAKQDELTLEYMKHYIMDYNTPDKRLGLLIKLLKTLGSTHCVIFVNNIASACWLSKEINEKRKTEKDVPEVFGINHEMEMKERDGTIQKFWSSSCSVIVTTDSQVCGIHFQRVSWAINYDVPDEPERYIRRAARFRKGGCVISFARVHDFPWLFNIQRRYKIDFENLGDVSKLKSHTEERLVQRLATEEDTFFASCEQVYETHDGRVYNLEQNLARGIADIRKLYEIEKRHILPYCLGRDVVQKTVHEQSSLLTFCGGILQKVDYKLRECQCLIISYSRRRAGEIKHYISSLCCSPLCVNVGLAFRERYQLSSSGVQVLVGTPSELLGVLLGWSTMSQSHIKIVVLDGADKIHSLDFKNDVSKIFQILPFKPQVGVYSKRFLPEVVKMTRLLTHNPVGIRAEKEKWKHAYIRLIEDKDKAQRLVNLLYECCAKVVVFVNKIDDCLVQELKNKGYNYKEGTHGGQEFVSGSTHLLIVNPVCARSVEFQQWLEKQQELPLLVLHYDLPDKTEDYLSRITLCGKKGVSVPFFTRKNWLSFFDILKSCQLDFQKRPWKLGDLLVGIC